MNCLIHADRDDERARNTGRTSGFQYLVPCAAAWYLHKRGEDACLALKSLDVGAP